MKVQVVSRTCGPGQSRRKGQRKGREKRKSPKSRARDRAGTGGGSPIGMNSAQPVAAERIRRSWGGKECAARGPVGRKVGALVMRWKKRKKKSRAPFAAPFGAQGEQGKQAGPLQGLAGAGRILVAGRAEVPGEAAARVAAWGH